MMESPNIRLLTSELSRIMQSDIGGSKEIYPSCEYISLVPLRVDYKGTDALLCIPGAGATVTSFSQLTNELGSNWTVYGLQPRGLDGTLIPHATVESCANHYLEQAKDINPTLPLHILGHSLGGWIAIELASIMVSRGRNVSSLTIIDSGSPDECESTVRDYTNLEVLLKWIEVNEAYYETSLGLSKRELEALPHASQIALCHRRLVQLGVLPRHSRPVLLEGPLATFARGLRTNYTPKRAYEGKSNLVLAKYDLDNMAYDAKYVTGVIEDWKRWVPNLVPFSLAGNHISILRSPLVRSIAQVLFF